MKRMTLAIVAALFPVTLAAQDAHQFLAVGHIESFTVDNPADPLSQAHLTVHGLDVLLPSNLIIQMPARYLTASDIVNLNPAAPGTNSGLALDDSPTPLVAYEATVVGNIVGGQYIAGLVWIAQHSLAEGAGFIRDIATDGTITIAADPDPGSGGTTARIRINDPDGRFAPPDLGADERFKVDDENPTILAMTGYPMCIAQAALPGECPASNRPISAGGTPIGTFAMGAGDPLPGSPGGAPDIPRCPGCDQTKQAPLLPGDYVLFSGTLAEDGTGRYISAHTVEANVGIYTAPGVDPAYVFIEGALIGTQGPLVPREGAGPNDFLPQETQDRLKIEGGTTDPTRSVELYAVDVDPQTGDTRLRLFNTVPTQAAPLGRFRLILGARANALFDGDTLVGASRELMARVSDGAGLDDQPVPEAPTFANGLVAGQYVAPFGEFIFPENKLIGDPILPNNFDCLPFLLNGSGPLETTGAPGPVVGRLDPWPDATVPAADAEVECGPRPKPLL